MIFVNLKYSVTLFICSMSHVYIIFEFKICDSSVGNTGVLCSSFDSVQVEGYASEGFTLLWREVAASFDISTIPRDDNGNHTVTVVIDLLQPTYSNLDNLRILASASNVEIPRVTSCVASAEACPQDVTDTVNSINGIPCSEQQCFQNPNCGWCEDECCEDWSPGATEVCPNQRKQGMSSVPATHNPFFPFLKM